MRIGCCGYAQRRSPMHCPCGAAAVGVALALATSTRPPTLPSWCPADGSRRRNSAQAAAAAAATIAAPPVPATKVCPPATRQARHSGQRLWWTQSAAVGEGCPRSASAPQTRRIGSARVCDGWVATQSVSRRAVQRRTHGHSRHVLRCDSRINCSFAQVHARLVRWLVGRSVGRSRVHRPFGEAAPVLQRSR